MLRVCVMGRQSGNWTRGWEAGKGVSGTTESRCVCAGSGGCFLVMVGNRDPRGFGDVGEQWHQSWAEKGRARRPCVPLLLTLSLMTPL